MTEQSAGLVIAAPAPSIAGFGPLAAIRLSTNGVVR
jgi:hypothetical protein